MVHYGALKRGRAVPIQLTKGVGWGGAPLADLWPGSQRSHSPPRQWEGWGVAVVMEGLCGDE